MGEGEGAGGGGGIPSHSAHIIFGPHHIFTCTGPSPSNGNEALSPSNVYRQWHHAPALSWDASLESAAQSWANYLASNCLFQHGGNPGQGQSLAGTMGSKYTWKQVVDGWYSEVAHYRCVCEARMVMPTR